MKYLLLSLILSAPLLSSAPAAASPCDTFLACGTYEEKDDQGNSLRIEIFDTGPYTARANYDLVQAGKDFGRWPLDFTITEEGLFTMRIEGRLYTAGICKAKICTYGMSPWQPKDLTETIGNAGIFKFYEDRMELRMNWGTPKEPGTGLNVLSKVK